MQRAPLSVFSLWWCFCKIGAVLLGGGYAMLPLLERDLVTKKKWATSDEVQNYLALAQLLPGVIAINMSMLTGNRLLGFRGNLAAAFGTVTVPFLCIVAYALAYDSVRSYPLVEAAMEGMRPAVAGMITGLGLAMVRKAARTRPALALSVAVCLLMVLFDPPVVAVLGVCIVAGVFWAAWIRRKAVSR